jgi:catechol-2,3-dioxygenase
VQLVVSDIKKSALWYSAVLGLDPFVQDDDIGYVALKHREAKFVVVLTRSPDDDDTSEREERRGALDHLAFAVRDGESLRAWPSASATPASHTQA